MKVTHMSVALMLRLTDASLIDMCFGTWPETIRFPLDDEGDTARYVSLRLSYVGEVPTSRQSNPAQPSAFGLTAGAARPRTACVGGELEGGSRQI